VWKWKKDKVEGKRWKEVYICRQREETHSGLSFGKWGNKLLAK
jgi:hypothetical protein